MANTEIRTYVGVPPVGAFGSSIGTPVVIDTSTGIAYFLAPGDVVTAIGGSGAGALTIEEVDGVPSVSATKLVLPNGTLSVVGTVATYTPSAAGASKYRTGAYWPASATPNLTLPLPDVQAGAIPAAVTIQRWDFTTQGGTGSMQLDVWMSALGAVASSADSICGGNYPTITAGISASDTTLTSWTTAVASGRIPTFHVRSVSGTFTSATFQLVLG